MNADDPLQPTPIDLVEAARTACARAIGDVVQMLRQRQKEAKATSKAAEAFDLKRIAPALLLDLQVGWKPEAIVLLPDATVEDLVDAFNPGYHGLAARPRGTAPPQATRIWPATALAINLRPAGQVRSLLRTWSSHHVGKTDTATIAKLQFVRFRVIHYVRPARHQPRMRLVRGNVSLPPRALTGADLTHVTAMLADHLMTRVRADGSYPGTYHPTTSRFEPVTASAGEAALVAYVLARRLHALCSSPSNEADRDRCTALRNHVAQVARHLAPPFSDAGKVMDVGAASLLVLTLHRMDRMPDAKIHRDLIVRRLLAHQSKDGMFRVTSPRTAPAVTPTTQCLVVLALMAAHDQTRAEILLPAIDRGRAALWQIMDQDLLVSTLPWSAMVTHGLPGAGTGPSDPKMHADAFAQLDRTIAKMQIVNTAIDPHDVFGGYAFDRESQRWPTADWRTAPLLAYTSLRLRHAEAASPAARIKPLLACGRAARFVAQLMVDEPGCYYGLDAAAMTGGVRSALWDNRLPLDRTAMALLALTELQATIVGMAAPGP